MIIIFFIQLYKSIQYEKIDCKNITNITKLVKVQTQYLLK